MSGVRNHVTAAREYAFLIFFVSVCQCVWCECVCGVSECVCSKCFKSTGPSQDVYFNIEIVNNGTCGW